MRGLRITAVALLTAVIGVACGSPGNDSGAIQLISAAAVANNEAGTSKVSMEMTMGAAGQSWKMTGEGAMDIEAELAHMTVSMSSDDPAMGLPAMGDMEMVTAGLKVYTKYPPEIADQIPGNKPWAMVDMQAFGEAQGMDFGAMSQMGGGNDPSQMLQYLRGVSGEVETVDEEEVRGITTTHYRAEIDLDKAADNAPKDLRDAVRMSIETMKQQLGTMTIPLEVWIGDDGYVHRMSMQMKTGEDAPQPFQMDMTMEFYDFGEPVKVEIPAPSQVYDMTEMMTGMGGGTAP